MIGEAKQEGMTAYVERFNLHHRLQHMLMLTSFTVLVITGLPIKYASHDWAKWVVALFGGFENMFYTHLGAAVVMIADSIYHLLYLMWGAMRGRWSWAMVPTGKDFRDFGHQIAFYLGLRKEEAAFDRYSYKEKFDYWAVFWGMFIMAGSGLMLWFPQVAMRWFPRWLVEAARAAHSAEAMLATLAIFVWHFYNVHFSPRWFPANLVFWHGKIRQDWLKHEHPAEYGRVFAKVGAESAAGGEADDGEECPLGYYERSAGLILLEMAVIGVILVVFLWYYLPLGLH